jgi:hypothetical protein
MTSPRSAESGTSPDLTPSSRAEQPDTLGDGRPQAGTVVGGDVDRGRHAHSDRGATPSSHTPRPVPGDSGPGWGQARPPETEQADAGRDTAPKRQGGDAAGSSGTDAPVGADSGADSGATPGATSGPTLGGGAPSASPSPGHSPSPPPHAAAPTPHFGTQAPAGGTAGLPPSARQTGAIRPGSPRPPREVRAGIAAARPVGSRSRRARLSLRRVDPWSVFLFSLVASVFVGIALVAAVAVLYAALGALGVTSSLNELFAEVTGGSESAAPLLSAGRIVGGAGVLAAVNVVFLTLLATLGALLYNLCASFTGGVELTFGERD